MFTLGFLFDLIRACAESLREFASPCRMPLYIVLAAYLGGGYVRKPSAGGDPAGSAGSDVFRILLFTGGFALLFILVAAPSTSPGRWLWLHRSFVDKLSGVVLVFLGMRLAGFGDDRLFFSKWGVYCAGVLGALVGVIWTPCPGEMLTLAVICTGSVEAWGPGLLLLTAYAAGLVLTLVAAGLLGSIILDILPRKWITVSFIRYLPGLILVLIGILCLAGRLNFLVPAGVPID